MPIMENLNFGTVTPLYSNPIPIKNIIHLWPNSNTTTALWRRRACSCAVCWSCCSWSCFFKPRFGHNLMILMGLLQLGGRWVTWIAWWEEGKKNNRSVDCWWPRRKGIRPRYDQHGACGHFTKAGLQPTLIGFNQHLRPQRAVSWRCDCCARWCPQSYNLVNHIN